MVTVKRLCEYLERELYWRELVHKTMNNIYYGMCVQDDNEDQFRNLLQKRYDSDKQYLLRQCMTLIALSMIERGEY